MSTVAALVPFIVAGMFLPTWTSRVILFLGTERPLLTALSYIAGNATWRVMLGTAVLLSFEVQEPLYPEVVIPDLFAWALAAIFVAGGVLTIIRRPKTNTDAGALPRWMQAYRRIPAWATFLLGFVSCASPGIQWVYFLGGMGAIVSSSWPLPVQFALMLVFVLLLETMLLVPVGLFLRYHDQAAYRFEAVERWVGRNGSTMMGLVLIGVGALLAVAAAGPGPSRI